MISPRAVAAASVGNGTVLAALGRMTEGERSRSSQGSIPGIPAVVPETIAKNVARSMGLLPFLDRPPEPGHPCGAFLADSVITGSRSSHTRRNSWSPQHPANSVREMEIRPDTDFGPRRL